MRRYRTIAPYLLPFVCVGALLCVAAQKKESGSDPYTPTKLEWLVVESEGFAAQLRPRCGVIGIGPEKPSTICILLYLNPLFTNAPDHEKEYTIGLISDVRKALEAHARIRGWDSWLKVKEKVIPPEQPNVGD